MQGVLKISVSCSLLSSATISYSQSTICNGLTASDRLDAVLSVKLFVRPFLVPSPRPPAPHSWVYLTLEALPHPVSRINPDWKQKAFMGSPTPQQGIHIRSQLLVRSSSCAPTLVTEHLPSFPTKNQFKNSPSLGNIFTVSISLSLFKAAILL